MDTLFRNSAVERSSVRIGVCMARAGVTFGSPSGIGPSSVAVEFDGISGPRLLLGAHVELDVAGAGAPLHVHAWVAARAVSRSRLRYDFAFDDQQLTRLLDELQARVAAVSAPCSQMVKVCSDTQPPFPATLEELSSAGLSIRVRFPHDRELAPGQRADVLVALGGELCLLPCVVLADEALPDGAVVALALCTDAMDAALRRRVDSQVAAGRGPSIGSCVEAAHAA